MSTLKPQPLQMLPHVLCSVLLSMFYGLFVFTLSIPPLAKVCPVLIYGVALDELSGRSSP